MSNQNFPKIPKIALRNASGERTRSYRSKTNFRSPDFQIWWSDRSCGLCVPKVTLCPKSVFSEKIVKNHPGARKNIFSSYIMHVNHFRVVFVMLTCDDAPATRNVIFHDFLLFVIDFGDPGK